MAHVLIYLETGRSVNWDGNADIYRCACGSKQEVRPGAEAPKRCVKDKPS